jgi:1,4-dihydroxy-2-naphthoate octaprenyltransferase
MKVWIKALRPRTLPLALSSIAMGSFLSVAYNAFNVLICILAVITTAFLQMLSNLANDYGDYQHGADSAVRKGPSRMVQSGKIKPSRMKKVIYIFIILSLASGITLLIISFEDNWDKFLPFLILGIACILAAIGYTMGGKPYGYAGLGDISVFIFFGFIGVAGSFYLFTHSWENTIILPAISCGLFSVAVLNVNNIRDIDSDREAGKFSIPVRIGRKNAIVYHWILILGGIAGAIAFTLLNLQSSWQWLFLVSVPFLLKNGIKVSKVASEELDPYLRQMALSTLLFVITFGLGLVIAI